MVQGQAIPPADPDLLRLGPDRVRRPVHLRRPGRLRHVRVRGDGPPRAVRVHRLGSETHWRPQGRAAATPSHPVRPRTTPRVPTPAASNSSVGEAGPGDLVLPAWTAVEPEPPVGVADRRRERRAIRRCRPPAPATAAADPWHGRTGGGPTGCPGVSAHPGCMAWKSSPDSPSASHPLVHQDQLGPLGPGVGHRAVVSVRLPSPRCRGRTAGCTCRPRRPGSPGTARVPQGSEQEAGEEERAPPGWRR